MGDGSKNFEPGKKPEAKQMENQGKRKTTLQKWRAENYVFLKFIRR
jgi:hypothetical protein